MMMSEQYKMEVYKLYASFQKEKKFFKSLTKKEFNSILFNSQYYCNNGSFVCIENNSVIGFISCNVTDQKREGFGYINTIIVAKEYRLQGVGTTLLRLGEEYLSNMGKKNARFVFLSQINWPWYIPNTPKHIHPGMPCVPINSPFYLFLYHNGYKVNSIHEGFHVDLRNYYLPSKVIERDKENEKLGIVVEKYDATKHHGLDEFCEEATAGFARAIKSNLARKSPYPFIVAALNGEIVGWTGAIYTEPSGRGHLDGIFVSAKVRGKGLGTSIFARLCYESKQNNAQYMTLFTGLDNYARYIYMGAGFNVAQSFADMCKEL